MTLLCTINGQPATIEIPALAMAPGALTKAEAAKYLGVSLQTIWRLKSTGQIACTSYGTYPISSLQSHLSREIERASK